MIALIAASLLAVLSLLTAFVAAIVSGNMIVVAALVASIAGWLITFWLICDLADPPPPVDDNHGPMQAERDLRSSHYHRRLR